MATEDETHDTEYLDDKEFQAKFLLDPDIPEDVLGQYSHLDKNLAITNLRYERNGMNEPDEVRFLCKALHVLNLPKYYAEEAIDEFEGYREVLSEDKKTIIRVPIFKRIIEKVPKFPKTFHAIRSNIYAFVNTAASRQGHRIRAATTTRRVKEESFEDRSSVNNRWTGSKNK